MQRFDAKTFREIAVTMSISERWSANFSALSGG
jgi:hypothetical protein